MNRRRLAVALIFAGMAVGLTVALRLGYGSAFDLQHLQAVVPELRDRAHGQPALAVAAYFGVYVLISVAAFFPAAIALNLLGGAVFGTGEGGVLVSTASASAATLVFLVVRYAFRDVFLARYGRELARFNHHLETSGALYVWLVRVTPVFPFALVNIVMALTPVPLSTFFLVSALGMLPASVAYAYLGSKISEMHTLDDLLDPRVAVAFTALGVLPLAARFLMNRLRGAAA